jgi:hypothetical protein
MAAVVARGAGAAGLGWTLAIGPRAAAAGPGHDSLAPPADLAGRKVGRAGGSALGDGGGRMALSAVRAYEVHGGGVHEIAAIPDAATAMPYSRQTACSPVVPA